MYHIFSGELAYAPEPIIYVCNYNYSCMKIAIILKILLKYIPSRINCKMVLKISSLELPHSKHVSKNNFLSKMGFLKKFI